MKGGVMDSGQAAAGAIYSPPALPFASFPAAASVPGQYRIASDLNNATLRSDGTYWSPANGHAVIANAHNVNLTIQSIAEALITSVSFPAGFVRAGSRIRTWHRWTMPGVGSAARQLYLRTGAAGGGVDNPFAARFQVGTNASVNQLELLNTMTALSSNGATRQTTIDNIGLHGILSGNTGNYAPVVNFTQPWEIAFTGVSAAETAQTGVTATWSAGVATFAKTAHGYAVGDKIANNTFDRAGYNGTLVVASAAADTWTAAIASDPGGAESGGTTSRISNVTLVDYLIEWMQ